MGLTTEQLHFTDGKVCRNFLCGTCPHDLFSNTKVDLGPCPKSHTARLKDEFKAALGKGDQYPQFDAEYEDNIRMFMADIDRKIAANKRRIDQTPEETAKFTNLMRDISEIEAAMNAAMAEVEKLGEQGEVEASLQELQKAEALKQEKADRERDLQILSDSAGASGHQKLRVCDVCGAYLSILDSDRRLADHFGGRMHLGYLRLREIITGFDERRSRGEDPRSLMARGIGTKPPSSTTTNGHSAAPNGYAYGAGGPPSSSTYPPSGMGSRPSYASGGNPYATQPPPPHTNGSSSSGRPPLYGGGLPPAAPAGLNYGAPPSSSSSGGYDRERYGGSDRDRDRDRRDRREGRDYRDRSPVSSSRRRSRSPDHSYRYSARY